jgi:hypothetical protein
LTNFGGKNPISRALLQHCSRAIFILKTERKLTIMNKIKAKIAAAKLKARSLVIGMKSRLFDTKAEGHVDTAVKIIIGVVIGALVLAGLILLWNTVIMPRLNTEIGSMFG